MFRTISLIRAPLIRSLFSSSSSSSHTNTIQPFSILSSPFSHSSKHPRNIEDESSTENRGSDAPPKLFVVQPRFRSNAVLQANLSEALNLASSLEDQRDEVLGEKGLPQHLIVQNPSGRSSKSHSDTYFGPGTVDTIKCHLNAMESEDGVDAVFVNTTLSGVQQRNLERAWGKPVLDRVGLIIEIFNAHAQTKEAKLQSELAALMYKRTRLVRIRGPSGRLTFGASGEAEVVSARGRGSGGRGFIGGAGETELQLQRRRIIERKTYLLSQIEEVRRTRAVQRASRRRRGGLHGQGLATVAVVGYTNAGKSTLVNALSHSDLYSDDRLFATVDPRLRSVLLPSGTKVLLSDTVGFISDLPVQLVEAFHATLEEVVEADLLVHVLDSSAENLEEQRSSVLQVLQQIGVSEEKLQNMIEVWNKIDVQGKNNKIDGSVEEEDEEAVNLLEGQEADVEADLPFVQYVNEYQMGVGLSTGETVDDQLSSSEKLNIVSNQENESAKDWEINTDAPLSKPHDVTRVETSALKGVGLQQLLCCIDDKLSTHKVIDRASFNCFNHKWRPSQIADVGTST